MNRAACFFSPGATVKSHISMLYTYIFRELQRGKGTHVVTIAPVTEETIPYALLAKACKEFGLAHDDLETAFRRLCELGGLDDDTTKERLDEFAAKPTALPRVVHESYMEHVVGIPTS
jgi:hypothetical protein